MSGEYELTKFKLAEFYNCSYLWLLFSQEAVAETLEELWISYNNIEKLKGIGVLKKLKVMISFSLTYLCFCMIDQDWGQDGIFLAWDELMRAINVAEIQPSWS